MFQFRKSTIPFVLNSLASGFVVVNIWLNSMPMFVGHLKCTKKMNSLHIGILNTLQLSEYCFNIFVLGHADLIKPEYLHNINKLK